MFNDLLQRLGQQQADMILQQVAAEQAAQNGPDWAQSIPFAPQMAQSGAAPNYGQFGLFQQLQGTSHDTNPERVDPMMDSVPQSRPDETMAVDPTHGRGAGLMSQGALSAGLPAQGIPGMPPLPTGGFPRTPSPFAALMRGSNLPLRSRQGTAPASFDGGMGGIGGQWPSDIPNDPTLFDVADPGRLGDASEGGNMLRDWLQQGTAPSAPAPMTVPDTQSVVQQNLFPQPGGLPSPPVVPPPGMPHPFSDPGFTPTPTPTQGPASFPSPNTAPSVVPPDAFLPQRPADVWIPDAASFQRIAQQQGQMDAARMNPMMALFGGAGGSGEGGSSPLAAAYIAQSLGLPADAMTGTSKQMLDWMQLQMAQQQHREKMAADERRFNAQQSAPEREIEAKIRGDERVAAAAAKGGHEVAIAKDNPHLTPAQVSTAAELALSPSQRKALGLQDVAGVPGKLASAAAKFMGKPPADIGAELANSDAIVNEMANLPPSAIEEMLKIYGGVTPELVRGFRREVEGGNLFDVLKSKIKKPALGGPMFGGHPVSRQHERSRHVLRQLESILGSQE